MQRRKPVINALNAVLDIREGMDDAGLMKKYNISFKGLESLLKKLFASGALTQADMDERKRRSSEDSVIIDVGELLLDPSHGGQGSCPRTLEKSVLLLSDDRSLVDAVSQYLAIHDFHVVKTDGETIDEQLISRTKPDVVLADLGLNGMETTQLVRVLQESQQPIPIILVVDAWGRERAEMGVDQGAYDFVEKPVEGKTVLRVVRRALEYASLLQLKKDHLQAIEDQVTEQTIDIIRTKDFLKGILDSSTLVSVILTDFGENILFWNKGAENIFGYTDNEMVGAKMGKLFPPDRLTQDTVEEMRRAVDRGIGTAYGKMNHVAKDGRVLTMSLALSPMRDMMGELLGVLWMGLDVTEEVRQNKEIFKLLHEVRKTQDAAIFALAKLIESRGEETGAHLSRIQAYCRVMCNKLAKNEKYQDIMTGKFIDDLARSSVLHDIGMVALPDSILWSPDRLHPRERELLSEHPKVGGKALEEAVKKLGEKGFLSIGMDVGYFHHECWDGSGYPYGKSGEDIPLSARIVGLVDAYDDMTTSRGKKTALSHEEALDRMMEGKGTLYDPELVDVFKELESEFRKIRETISFD
jgi:putative two-component system response regulator